MSEPIRFEVLADEHVEEEETVSGDELFNNIMAGFAELEEFAQAGTAHFSSSQASGEQAKSLRVTEYIDGERVSPVMLTQEDLTARRASRKRTPLSSVIAASPVGTGCAASHRADVETEPATGQTTTKAGTTSRSI